MADFSNAHSNRPTLSVLYDSYCMDVQCIWLSEWYFNNYKSVECYIAHQKTVRRNWLNDKRLHNVLTNLINGCLSIIREVMY